MATAFKNRIVGLTGPIGAGKDEVAKLLRRRRITVIDADQLAHTLYNPQSPLWHKLVRAFGSKILNRGGKINRGKLGEIVFGDRRKLRELNGLVHPYLKKAIVEKLESRKQKVEHRKPFVVINAAVLKEIGLLGYVDEVWLVMASKDVRKKRLIRSGLSKREAEARLRSQMSRSEYLKISDRVIWNDGSRPSLKKQVLKLL